MTKPLSDSVCIVRGCGNPSQMPDSEYCASCAATPNAEILAAWRAAIENWDGPDIEDANYSPAMFAAGFEAGRAAVPRECLCKTLRKTLTTDAGTWHICETCSSGYFLKYDAATGQRAGSDSSVGALCGEHTARPPSSAAPDVAETDAKRTGRRNVCTWLREWSDQDMAGVITPKKDATLGYIAARMLEEDAATIDRLTRERDEAGKVIALVEECPNTVTRCGVCHEAARAWLAANEPAKGEK